MSQNHSTKITSILMPCLLAVVASIGCDQTPNGADNDKTAETKPAETKSAETKPAETAKAEPSKAEPPKVAQNDAKADEIDVDALLAAPDAAGVTHIELDAQAVAHAPRLGASTAGAHAAIREAQWLVLPGDTLEIPNPPGWPKKHDADTGLIAAPDGKVAVLFTHYTTQQEVVAKLDEVGKLAGITSVAWKEPKQVQLGEDGLPALVRAGEATVKDGNKARILFALVETGVPEKVLVIGIGDKDATKEDQEVAGAVLMSIRKKR